MDDDLGAEDLVRALMRGGYALFSTVEHDNGRLATARLRRNFDGADITVDLLFASSGIEPEIVHEAETLAVVPGLEVPVARRGHLIALKLLARDDLTRPQDLADLLALRAAATPEDLAVADGAVRLIVERGYNRNRDLVAALDDLRSSTPSE